MKFIERETLRSVDVYTIQVIKKCPDVLSVLLGTDSTTVRSTVSTTVRRTFSTTVHSTVSTYVLYASKKKCPYGKVKSMVVTVKLAALREQLPSVFIDPCLYYRCTSY